MGTIDLIPEHDRSTSGFNKHEDAKYKYEDWLREQYIDKDRSQADIARECNVGGQTIRRWRDKFGIRKGTKCPLCGHRSVKIGHHFRYSDHGYPDIDQYKWEILVGHIMGDASYHSGSDYGLMRWNMTNLDYMRWINEELEWLCYEPYLLRTPEESAQNNFLKEINVNFFDDDEKQFMTSDPDNIKPVYMSHTTTHPWIDKLDWMEDGKKRFPETLKLTPTMVKIWYCDDGNLNWGGDRKRPSASIAAYSQLNVLDILADKFEDAVCRPEVQNGVLRFNVNKTEDLLEWMGDAPDGMRYKFCLESKERYNNLKP